MISYFGKLDETKRYIARHRLTRNQVASQLRKDMNNALIVGCCGEEEHMMRLEQILMVLLGDPEAFREGAIRE